MGLPLGPRTRLATLLGAAGVVAVVALAPRALAEDVPESKDDPPGCTTATSESDDGCGAQGRNHTSGAAHQPPIEACAGQRSAAGSTITRIVPAGPLRADGGLAFTSGACVYLPPGYDSSGMAYPVLYLLHGGGGDQAAWVTFGGVQEILDDAYAADPDHALIAVMPDGRSGQFYDYKDQRFLNETYLLRSLVPAVDARLRTIADRSGRAIAGLSNGGYGALHMAAKAPDLFSVAGSMSGNLGARTMDGLGPAGEVYYQGNVPHQLAGNLDPVDLIIDWGATCSSDAAIDGCSAWGFEQAFRIDNQEFRSSLDDAGYTGTVDYRETEGGHAWRWWSAWLRDRDLPFFYERLAPPTTGVVTPSPVPASFRYRSIFPQFQVWGYDVRVQRDTAEFMDLTDVTAGGFTVQGSGSATVRTAPRYRANEAYQTVTDGGAPVEVIADELGRLVVEVDLGPSGTQSVRKVAIAGAGAVATSPVLAHGAAGATGAANVTSTGAPKVDQSALPGVSGDSEDNVGPDEVVAVDGSVDGTASARPAAHASLRTEPVRRVSVPLTVLVLGLAGGGSSLWWRRRRSAQQKDG